MPFFLKDLILIGFSVIVALFVSLGIVEEQAVAPDVDVPERIVEAPQDEATSTIPKTDNLIEEEEEPQITSPETEEPVAPVAAEPEEDPFRDLAEAFQKLAEEQVTPAPVSGDTNATVRESVVNILCTTAGAGPFSPISASGVIIDPKGVVLTNAHVAQYFLLENYPIPGFVECILRTGSPAQPTYTAELLFLPPSWIRNNAQKIDDETPTGNGEHDYAFLRITGTINTTESLPSSFPFLPVALGSPDTGTPLIVAGYPAGFLGGITVQKELYATSANVTVGQIYTYGGNSVDLFSIGGSVVAQQGASGGAAADGNGILFGLIVTSSDAPDTASRDLRALTTSYIVRDFERESGVSLESYLAGNLPENARLFNLLTAPTLTKGLTDVLDN